MCPRYAAILDYLYMNLGIRDAVVLTLLVLCFKWVSRGLSQAAVKARWHIVKLHVLVNLVSDLETRVKICEYFQNRWLIDEWIDSWTDAGRIALGLLNTITTNNYVERFWIDYISLLCR